MSSISNDDVLANQAANTDTSASPAESAPTEAVNINLTDIYNAAVVIDLASSRGAFRAGEMKEVGVLYEKLVNFYKVHAPADAPAAEVTETEPAMVPADDSAPAAPVSDNSAPKAKTNVKKGKK